MQNVPVRMQKHWLPVSFPTMWAVHAHEVQGAEPQVHSRGDVTVETRTFRPTPFQVTELSLQQEEALPGSGPSQGSPAWYPVSRLAGRPVMVTGATGASQGCRPGRALGADQRHPSAWRGWKLGRSWSPRTSWGAAVPRQEEVPPQRRPFCPPGTALGLPELTL